MSIRTTTHTATAATALAIGTGVAAIAPHAAYANANVPQPILTDVSLVTLPVTVPKENETPSKTLISAPYVIDPSYMLEPIPILELIYAFSPYQSLIFNPTPINDVELPIFEYL